jgi:outer membrane protein assembly factor BamB
MPLVLGDAVYVVTAAGDVRAVHRASGARRWVSAAVGYVGPPVELGGMPLVARTDGVVEALDPRTGRTIRTWVRPAVPGRTRASVSLGPGTGDGALWLADRAPAVWRLGAGGGAALPLAWTHGATDAPFSGRPLWTTPVPFAGRAVVLDEAGAIFLADARTGETIHIGALPPDAAYALTEPIVHGDTLLVAAGKTLHAFHLPDGRALWRFAADGASIRPPAVSGGTVLWTTQASFDGPTTRGRLHALDLATGRPRWSADLASLWMAAEPVVRDDVVYLGTPPSAWDLGTGRPRWSSPIAPSAVGAPVLAGDRLVVAAVDVAAGMGVVLGLDAATGRPRWRTPLGAGELPHPREPLWTTSGVVIVASSSGRIVGLDAATGRERWRHTPAAPRFGAITVAAGRVLFAQQDGRVVELDAGNGAATLHATGLDALAAVHGRFQRPLLVDDRLLLATGRALLGFTLERP